MEANVIKLIIGFVISEPLYELINDLCTDLNNYCEPVILTVKSNEEAYRAYLENKALCDIFIFSGKVFLYSVLKRAGKMETPYFAFDDMMGNIQDTLFRLLVKQRDFDFSRVFIDIAWMGNSYLGLMDILPENQRPYVLDGIGWNLSLLEGDAFILTDELLKKHIEMHQKGLIDLSITRFGTLLPKLSKLGMDCIYLEPSREYIMNFVLQALYSIDMNSEQKRMGAAAVRFLGEKGSIEEFFASTGQMLMKSAKEYAFDVSVQREKDLLVLLVSYEDLSRMTQSFTSLGFLNFFMDGNGYGAGEMKFGLGSGKSMFQAKRNAISATEISQSNPLKVYYISGKGDVMGPLGDDCGIYRLEPSDNIKEYANKFSLDTISLQRIVAYSKLCNTSIVSASGLAEFLEVTPRSANRLLGKIQLGGGAEVYRSKITNKAGRPPKCYHLTFIDKIEKGE